MIGSCWYDDSRPASPEARGVYEVELSLLIRLQNFSSFFLHFQILILFIQDVRH